MKKSIIIAAGSLAAIAIPSAAHAQAFGGISAGYHDLGVESEVEDEFGGFDVEIDDGSPIIGAFLGYDVIAGEGFFVGAEANFHIGTNAIDSEYGAAARVGFVDQGGAKYYLRGGYQEIDLDYAEIITVDGITFDDDDFAELDDTAGDFLVGGGVEFPLGTGAMLRVNVDTVGFDTARATAGVGFRF